MSKVNNKNTRTTSLTSFWCFYVNFEYISYLFLVFIVDFEQVNVTWDSFIYIGLFQGGEEILRRKLTDHRRICYRSSNHRSEFIYLFIYLFVCRKKQWANTYLTHFWPVLPFYTSWKNQKCFDFLFLSGCTKWENCPEVGQSFTTKTLN